MSTPTATRVSPAYADPDAVRRLIETNGGPFWPLANYAASDAELAALGSARNTFTPPWFRQDFAVLGSPLVEGAELILDNPAFVEAAHAVYGAEAVVRPTTVYVNIMGPTPFPFQAHLDIPAFRGFTRVDQPVWLLKTMKTSGLFEQWRIKIATVVSWFYGGPGGDFHYWPDGPDEPGCVERPPFVNVAVAADNEATFHGVAPLGPPGSKMPMNLTRESRLVRGDGGWDVHDEHGAVQTRFDDSEVRITVSWKADVFSDAEEARRVDQGEDRLDLATVVARFTDDLRARGFDDPVPADPLNDRDWISRLAEVYRDPAPAIA